MFYLSIALNNGMTIKHISKAKLPTRFGMFEIHVFEDLSKKEHAVLVRGDVRGRENVPVRVHSTCLTGDTFHSLRCDCHDQLHLAMRRIAKSGGMVIYLMQEGRGIGLGNKIKAYALQDRGYDTVEANLKLGFKEDERIYDIAADILNHFAPKSILLMTNNPDKIGQLRRLGIGVAGRIAHRPRARAENSEYLKVKRKKLGHL